MGFSQALSGLNAAAKNLEVMGNNIANSQTVGYKSSSMQFADVYAGATVGLGVKVAGVMQNFADGNMETTGRNLDLAISGTGFLRFVQNDQVVYARNGQLTLTADGYLENAQGARLTGYAGAAGSGGDVGILNISSASKAAQATSELKVTLNLDAATESLDPASFDPLDPDTYSYANSATVFDTLGTAHAMTMYFIKSDAAPNTWEVRVANDGDTTAMQSFTVTFDQNGVLDAATTPAALSFAMANGASSLDFNLNLKGTTQFANDSELSSLSQDGYTSGSLVSIAVDQKGQIVGTYSNERTEVLGTIAMVNFRNPEGLTPVSGGWLETSDSGQPLIGEAGTGMFGSIESGVVETSNVDLSKELVSLIIAQRTYQANSQTIKVQDEVLQQAVNLR